MPPVARWLRESVYKPISAYGVIGDTRSAALIGADGSIDWCCFPRFDSSSVFAAILDVDKGGSFCIQPAGEFTSQQRYFPLTNILVTGFHLHDGTGAFDVLDFMPAPGEPAIAAPHEIHRRIRGVNGRVEVSISFQPRFDYARAETRLELVNNGVCASSADETLRLTCPQPLEWRVDEETQTATTTCIAEPGRDVWLVLRWGPDDERAESGHASQRKLEATASFWNQWAGKLR